MAGVLARCRPHDIAMHLASWRPKGNLMIANRESGNNLLEEGIPFPARCIPLR